MNSTQLKIGFIGGAINSAVGTTHKIASQMDGCWSLSAGCFSSHEDINLDTAKQWGVDLARLHTSYQELLEKEKGNLDAVVVLTPTPSHAEIVISAIEQGYPVICEKALVKSSDEGKKIKEAIEKHNGFLAVTYNYTGYPMVRELQSIIREGQLGKLHHIQIEMPQEAFLRLDNNDNKPNPQYWRLKDHNVPTLSLDLGVHLHHMLHFLTDEHPLELTAKNNNYGFFEGIVDNTMCIAHYTNNIDCQIWFGKTALGNTNGLKVRVYGELGSAEWYQMRPETLILHDNKGRINTFERSSVDLKIANDDRYNRFKAGHPAGFIEAFANLYSDMADSLRKYSNKQDYSSPYVFGIDIAYEGIVMLEAIAKSASNQSWESIKL